MPKVLLIIAGCAFVVLLGATIWMLIVNWNEKLLSSVSSIIALGVAAVFVAVFAGMKEVNTERAFLIEWPYDNVQRSMPMIVPSSVRTFELTLNRASMRAAYAVNSVNGNPPKKSRPQNPQEVFGFFLDLAQAQILNEIRDFQGNQQINSAENPATFVPVKIPNNYRYSGDVFSSLMKTNPFLNDMDKFTWDHVGIQLPKGTEISLISVPSSPITGPEKRVVQLTKPNYFQIDIEVIARGSSPGVPVYLTGSQTLAGQPGLEGHMERVGMMITEKAHFSRYTSQGDESQGYQKWAGDLFKAIEIAFSN
jgi:hypothetical protein